MWLSQRQTKIKVQLLRFFIVIILLCELYSFYEHVKGLRQKKLVVTSRRRSLCHKTHCSRAAGKALIVSRHFSCQADSLARP